MAAELSGVRLAGIGDEAAPDLGGQMAAHQRLGWPEIELRTIGGRQIAELPAETVRAVARRLSDAGLTVTCVASGIGAWGRTTGTAPSMDEDELERLAPRLALLGCNRVRVMSFPREGALARADWGEEARRRLRRLARRAEQLGIVLLHENCAGYGGLGPDEALELLAGVDSPALRLLFDLGNGLSYGYSSADFLRPTLPWVEHVHVKDGLRTGDGIEWCLPGQGEAEVRECAAMLLASGYRGVWTIEPHLRVAPHRGRWLAGDGAIDEFIAYGRAFERLLADVESGVAV